MKGLRQVTGVIPSDVPAGVPEGEPSGGRLDGGLDGDKGGALEGALDGAMGGALDGAMGGALDGAGQGTPLHAYLLDRRFRKTERLLAGHQFDVVFKNGSSASTPWLTVKAVENGLGHPRLGLVVSRKVGRAVRRNRLKRVIREVFRNHKAEFGAIDVVVMPRGRECPEDLESLSRVILELAGSIRERMARRR